MRELLGGEAPPQHCKTEHQTLLKFESSILIICSCKRARLFSGWRTLWGALWTLWGWMDDADDGGGGGDGDGEDLRLSFLYVQTPDQQSPRPLCYPYTLIPFFDAL